MNKNITSNHTRTEVTCGYRIEKDGAVKYYGGPTDDGECYKDLETFKNGEGVVYIGEYPLKDLDAGQNAPMWTKETLLKEIRTAIAINCDCEMADNDKFVEYIALSVLNACEWQEPTTVLNELIESDGIYHVYNRRYLWDNRSE